MKVNDSLWRPLKGAAKRRSVNQSKNRQEIAQENSDIFLKINFIVLGYYKNR